MGGSSVGRGKRGGLLDGETSLDGGLERRRAGAGGDPLRDDPGAPGAGGVGLLAVEGALRYAAGAIGFENFASGIGGVAVVAYLSALCNLRFTATQYALLSALASIAGRFLTGTTAGALIQAMGYVNFYLLTTLIAAPGVLIYWFMIRSGLADVSIGSAGQGQQVPERSAHPSAKA